jgi:hypothetical protein
MAAALVGEDAAVGRRQEHGRRGSARRWPTSRANFELWKKQPVSLQSQTRISYFLLETSCRSGNHGWTIR